METRELTSQLRRSLSNSERMVERLWGTIVAVDPVTNTVSLTIGASANVIPQISYLSSYVPLPNDVVAIDVVGTDLLVVGSVLNSQLSARAYRAGALTLSGAPLQAPLDTLDYDTEGLITLGALSAYSCIVPGKYLVKFAFGYAGSGTAIGNWTLCRIYTGVSQGTLALARESGLSFAVAANASTESSITTTINAASLPYVIAPFANFSTAGLASLVGSVYFYFEVDFLGA